MRESALIRMMKYTAAGFLLLFCLFPFVWMMVISIAKSPDFFSAASSFVGTMDNFSEILSGESFRLTEFLRNSLIVSAVSAAATTLFATLSAYTVTRLTFPGRRTIPLLLLGSSMFPQVSLVGYLFEMMTWLGWINTYSALIFPYITLSMPLALWIMMSYFSQIPKEFDNAALVDGATRFQILRSILFPIALPGILSTFILVFIFSFNEFLFALLLTIDFNARTLPVGIALFEGLHGQIPWGHIMAAAVVAVAPIALIIALFQRYIIGGLMQGAMKG